MDLSVAATLTPPQRLEHTLSLWPYMVPLVVVYFAEYALQSGVWAAMGFPVTSSSARTQFYEYANLCYQGGVVVSRSSGLLWRADIRALWVMPLLQLCMLLFFLLVAYTHFWYDWALLVPCFGVGLLGGAVYVGGFALIAESVSPQLKEFSLATASVSNGIGVALANIAGIFIQRALYRYYGLSDQD
ncbi:batten's disease protein Cln3 [Ochromonadaceae sp. CCMP2298]|nr:batten's disease protein Cln3 [Ochromonadaceae sp. CCMP2298]